MTIDTTASSAAAAAKPGGSTPSGVASPTAQAQSSAPTSSSTPPTNTTTSTAAASAGWTPTAASSSRSTATYHQPPTTATSSSPQPNVIKKSRNEVIKTIQEITKFDEFTINQAIEACQDSEGRYSMDTVLNILMDEKNLSEQQNQDSSSSTSTKRVSRPYGSSPASSSSSSSNNNNDDVPNKYSNANRSGASLHDRNNDIFGNMNNIDDEDDEDYDALMNCSSPATATTTTASNTNSSSQQQSTTSCKPLNTTGLIIEPNLIREESKPAGLKNIGNTCWFNSIIQSFFHLPKFRNIILSFKFDQYQIDKLDDNSRNMVLFVAELRKLFALMLKSRRKTINPSATLLCLRNCSKFDVEMFNQEDISEFSTILVNLLEESFDVIAKLQLQQQQQQQQQSNVIELPIHRVGEESGGDQQLANLLTDKLNIHRKNRKNPIVNLLNGDVLINRKNTDNDKTNEVVEIFREVNIQMLNSRNLHSGLELEWGETSIDKSTEPSGSSSSTSTTLKSPPTDATSIESSTLVPSAIHESSTSSSIYEQESWVVKLPAVLFICLNRYKFIQATQSSSKILEPFEFYPYMYLDRYLHTNRELIKVKRKELKELKHQLVQLEQKLKSIKEYKFGEAAENNSGSKYSLNEALKCVLHFATTDYTENDVFNNIRPLNVKHNEPGVEEDKKRLGEVEKCLRDWVHQLETRISNVESDMVALKHRIESIYDDDELHRVRYNLHSVCIHEGNALSGHFWTYVWQPKLAKWYKFNDTEVCESTWEDLYSNAVGGSSSSLANHHHYHHHNRPYQQNNLSKTNDLSNSKPVSSSSSSQQHLTTTLIDESSTSSTNTASNTTNKNNDKIPSAYFLIYTRAGDDTLYQENNELDVDLTKFLKDDQEALERQLNNYRLKQIYRDAVENMKRTSAQISAILKDSGNAQQSNEQMNQACMEHAKAFTDSTFEALTSSLDRIQLQASRGGILDYTAAEEALKHAVEFELARYTEEARDVQKQLPNTELRLNHILIYLSCNGVGRDVKQLALYDLFRMQVYPDVNIRMKIVQTLAHLKYNEYLLASLTPTSTAAPSNQAAAVFKTYEKWLFDYRDFRSIIAAFISAGNFLDSGRLEEATPFYCVACEYNERLTSYLKDKWKGMDHEFLVATRRKCLKQWNQQSIRKFSQKQQSAASSSPQQQPLSQQELSALFETMISKFLPCFFRLVTSTNEDKAFIEEIRQDWLNVLDSNLPEIQVFQDFMTKLFEDPVGNHYHSLNVNKTNLILKYRDVAIAVSQIRP